MGQDVWEYRKRLEEKSVLLCYPTAAGGQRVRHVQPGTPVPWPFPSFAPCWFPVGAVLRAWSSVCQLSAAALHSPAQLRLLP